MPQQAMHLPWSEAATPFSLDFSAGFWFRLAGAVGGFHDFQVTGKETSRQQLWNQRRSLFLNESGLEPTRALSSCPSSISCSLSVF
jgi:hypothetical protein